MSYGVGGYTIARITRISELRSLIYDSEKLMMAYIAGEAEMSGRVYRQLKKELIEARRELEMRL
jgi:hypothetical protein